MTRTCKVGLSWMFGLGLGLSLGGVGTVAAQSPERSPATERPIGPGRPETVRVSDQVRPMGPSRQIAPNAPPAEVTRPNRSVIRVAPNRGEPASPEAPGKPLPGRPRPIGQAEQAKLATGTPPKGAGGSSVKLKLAPSASEIESERRSKVQDSPTPATGPNGERDPREGTPRQDPRWPTHVDHTRGPGSPVGAGTSGDRKGTLEDASGPQQGVIRNRW